VSVLSKLFKSFTIYCGNNISPHEQRTEPMGQPKNTMP